MQDKFKNMLELQEKLNNETNGIEWKKGLTKEGKVINWYTCIYMECAEFIGSFDWKHWKKGKNDYENAKIELVDIFHFLLSLVLIQSSEYEEEAFRLDLLCSKFAFKESNTLQICEKARVLLHASSANEPELGKMLMAFFALCECVKLDLNELYKLYMGKNILNKFRQDRGYKEGTYLKVWEEDGVCKEDNVILQELLDDGLDLGKLYRNLDERYINALRIKENKNIE